MKRTDKKKENRKRNRKRKNNRYDNDILRIIIELINEKNFYKALSYIEDYLDINPNDLYGSYIKALILFNLDDVESSKEIIHMLEVNCDFSTTFFGDASYILMGDILKKENKCDEMLKYYKKAYKISPKDKLSFSVKRILDYYIEINDKENALKFCEEIPNMNNLNILKAYTYFSFNEQEKYVYYLNIFQEDKCEREALLNYYYCLRAHYLRIHNHPFNALEVLDNYNEKYNRSKMFYLEEKILALLSIKNYDEAYKYILKLPEFKRHSYLFEYYMKKFDFQKAYQEATKIENDNNRLLKLYEYYYFIGNIKKAEEITCKLLSSECDSKNLVKFLNCSIRKDLPEVYKTKYTMLEEYLNKDDMPVRLLECFVKKDNIEGKKPTYSENQIINYNKKKAIHHIKSHHGEKSAHISYFNNDTDIEKIFNKILIYIKDKKPYYSGVYDVYIVHIDKVKMSSIYYERLNDLVIITLPNTKNILTMYPVDMVDEDLNEIEKEENKKTYKLSQIEKFNKRYGNNY